MDNAASLFVDAPVEEGHGARAALLTPSGPVTYGDLQRLTDRAAHALRARGVEPEQRVAMLLPDGPAWAATFFAALKLGAVAVPLNTRLDAVQLRTVLADCRPKAVVADRAVLAAAGVDAAALGPRGHDFDALVARASDAALAPEPVGGDAMAFWLYTSGTTGSPKAAVHCHRALPACHNYLDVLGVTAADRIFATSKLFFAYALGSALLIPLRARASTYLHPGWPDPASVVTTMREVRPTLFFSVPTVYARLLHADLPSETFGSARLCVSAGERLPAELYAAWRERFGVEILDGIGATEIIFMMSPTGPGAAAPGPPASRCRARKPGSWTRRAGRCRTGRRACSGCAHPRRPPGTGSASTTRAGRSWATGSAPVTSTAVRRTAGTCTAAARTTSSRWPGSGWPRPR